MKGLYFHSETTLIPGSDKWFMTKGYNAMAKLNLFCFPYAGGSAKMFNHWKKFLPDDVNIIAVELPGHGRRITEKPESDIAVLVTDLTMAMAPYLDKPYILYGHSMGALIAYELTQSFLEKKISEPLHLVVSGHKAPHLPDRGEKFHLLNDEQLMEKTKELNGIPDQVLKEEELMKLILVILRADFSVVENYINNNHIPVTCPITAFGGRKDTLVSESEIKAWCMNTLSSFKSEIFDGGHFFNLENEAFFLSRITNLVKGHLK